MISVKIIKQEARKLDKKISKKATEKIFSQLRQELSEIIKKSARNADFFGRKTIKQEDFEV